MNTTSISSYVLGSTAARVGSIVSIDGGSNILYEFTPSSSVSLMSPCSARLVACVRLPNSPSPTGGARQSSDHPVVNMAAFLSSPLARLWELTALGIPCIPSSLYRVRVSVSSTNTTRTWPPSTWADGVHLVQPAMLRPCHPLQHYVHRRRRSTVGALEQARCPCKDTSGSHPTLSFAPVELPGGLQTEKQYRCMTACWPNGYTLRGGCGLGFPRDRSTEREAVSSDQWQVEQFALVPA